MEGRKMLTPSMVKEVSLIGEIGEFVGVLVIVVSGDKIGKGVIREEIASCT